MVKPIATVLLVSLGAAAQDAQQIVRRSVERDILNWLRARDYTCIRQVEEKKLQKNGAVKETETLAYEIMMLYGEPYERLIRRNGQPLPPEEEEKETGRVNKLVEKRKNETDERKANRLAEFEKRRQKSREFLRSVPDAFHFRLVGDDRVAERDTWVIEATPDPAFRPHNSDTKRMTKFRGKLWIAKADYEWVRIEAESIENISFGGILARLNKGAVIRFEQTRVNNEIWLPSLINIRFDARLALVSSMRRALEITFTDYRKFQSESRILSTSELPEEGTLKR